MFDVRLEEDTKTTIFMSLSSLVRVHLSSTLFAVVPVQKYIDFDYFDFDFDRFK